MSFLNRLLGGMINTLVLLPIVLLSIAFTPFLFIDRLIQGRIYAAIAELFYIPFKMLLLLISQPMLSFDLGYKQGLVGLILSFPQKLTHFFTHVIFTNSDYFLSAIPGTSYYLNHFEGGFFGAIIRKLIIFLFPSEQFANYETHDENPHNPIHGYEKNAVFQVLHKTYGPAIVGNEQNLVDEINQYIDALINETAHDKEAQNRLLIAKRCIHHFQEAKDLIAVDLDNNQSALNTLLLVWTAINNESKNPSEDKKVLVSYLIQIQHGPLPITSIEDTEEVNDEPECPTGAIGLLFDSLKATLKNPDYEIAPMPADGYMRMKALLTAKMDQNYNMHRNIIKNPTQTDIEKFTKDQKRPMNAYAHFLQHTPQGQKLFGYQLDEETLNATVDATVDAWTSHPMV